MKNVTDIHTCAARRAIRGAPIARTGGRVSHARSVSETEDAVQEAWIRLSHTDISGVDNLRGMADDGRGISVVSCLPGGRLLFRARLHDCARQDRRDRPPG